MDLKTPSQRSAGARDRLAMLSGPRARHLFPITGAVVAVLACAGDTVPEPPVDPGDDDPCDRTIQLPDGFCALTYHTGVGAARQLVVAENGDVFVALRNRGNQSGGVMALRDLDGDGTADQTQRWGEVAGSGIALGDEVLYLATDNGVLRYSLPTGSLTPSGSPETIVEGLPSDRNHATKSIALHADGSIFVGIGSPSNACQVIPRTAGQPGRDPCPELTTRAGIWRFASDQPGQELTDGERFSTGVRNGAALAVHPGSGELYAVIHGRDQLRELWSSIYSAADGSEKPSEEFVHVRQDTDFGWPYCYHDPSNNSKVLAPEYGGDGEEVGRCADMDMPEIGLPAHWAPNAMAFSTGDNFPQPYRNGAFVAFHGSWNRTPFQQGYNIVWIPFEGDAPTGEWEVFADGFAGGQISSSNQADNRPTGVAAGPDGSVYVSDSLAGKIWKIVVE